MKFAAWQPYNFGAASPKEKLVFGSCRPGYEFNPPILSEHITKWIQFMNAHGIRRVVCLLPPEQLTYYQDDLLEAYGRYFGRNNVCHAPISDFHLCDPGTLHELILPFLTDSVRMDQPVVVHCSGGNGRTGHILAAWLVYGRRFNPAGAINAVRKSLPYRDPFEAIHAGQATHSQLEKLLTSE